MKEKNQEPNLIVYSTQNYTALEKDVVSVAISNLDKGVNIQHDLFKNKLITVSAKMLNLSKDNYHRLKHVAENLTKKVIKIIDDKKEEFDFIVPFPRIKYKGGKLELTMFADVLPYFLELKNGYTEYYLSESLSLHGFRTKRLYELLSSRKKFYNPTWKIYDDFNVEKIKKSLKELLNIKISAYKNRPAQFETNYIQKSVDEINEKTSLNVSYTRDKDKHGWFTLFDIKDKNKGKKSSFVEPKKLDEKSQRCYNYLKNMSVRKDFINKIIEEYQPEFWAWLSANRDNLKNKKFRNPAGVLLVHLGLIEPKY